MDTVTKQQPEHFFSSPSPHLCYLSLLFPLTLSYFTDSALFLHFSHTYQCKSFLLFCDGFKVFKTCSDRSQMNLATHIHGSPLLRSEKQHLSYFLCCFLSCKSKQFHQDPDEQSCTIRDPILKNWANSIC